MAATALEKKQRRIAAFQTEMFTTPYFDGEMFP
jgi:hypothetical protein